MKILDLNIRAECLLPDNAAVALGNFDGVHVGHQRLFDALGDDLPRAVFTFTDLCREKSVICETDERLELMRTQGIRYAVLVSFGEVCKMSTLDFADFLAKDLNVRRVVCGYNFTFGSGGRGTAEELYRLVTERGLECTVVPPVTLDGESVSSTAIRCLLRRGDAARAAAMLGRHHFVRFPVIHGRELGRTIGVPTINQRFPENALVPRYGVYSVRVTVGDAVYPGVCNVGVRPTVADLPGEGVEPFAETHIIGFNGWLYGESVRVEFVRFIRPEMKFPSLDALKDQIRSDIENAKEDAP